MKAMVIFSMLFFCAVSWASSPRRIPAPPYERISREGIFSSSATTPSGSKSIPSDTIGNHPVIDGAGRGVLGSPGKNIAVCGDNIAVIWGSSSGLDTNYFYVSYGYSTDRGASWLPSEVLYDYPCRRVYPGVDWDPDAPLSRPYFVWQDVQMTTGYPDVPSTIYVTWDEDFPNGMMAPPKALDNSADWHCWMPCVAVKDSIILVTAWSQDPLPQNAYIWRSINNGLTWTSGTKLVDTEGSPYSTMDAPVVRFGKDGYVFITFDWGYGIMADTLKPHYMESLDWGATWSEPHDLWELTGGLPYEDCAGSWWYVYDCVIDTNNTPHCVYKYGLHSAGGGYEFGDVWVYRPTQGSPGNWTSWEVQCIVGDGQGDWIATQPSIGIELTTNYLQVIYKALWETELGNVFDIGHIFSLDGGETWSDRGPGEWYDSTDETAIEIATRWKADAQKDWCWGHAVYIHEYDTPRFVCHWMDSLLLANAPPRLTKFFHKGDTYSRENTDLPIWIEIADFGWPPDDSSGVEEVWLHWWVNSDTLNMKSDSMVLIDGTILDGKWEISIEGTFSVGDTIRYYFSAVDIQGLADKFPYPTRELPYTFEIREKEEQILLVVEDGETVGDSPNMDIWAKDVFYDLGYRFDYWDGVKQQAPDSSVIDAGYVTIIWLSWGGFDFAEDSLYIADFLSSGGQLWIAAQDLFCSGLNYGRCDESLDIEPGTFGYDYLMVDDVVDDYIGTKPATGLTENIDTVISFFGLDGDTISGVWLPGMDSITVYPYSDTASPDTGRNYCGALFARTDIGGVVENFFFNDPNEYPSALRYEGNYDLFLQLWPFSYMVDNVQMQDSLISSFVWDYSRMATFITRTMRWFGHTGVEERPFERSEFRLALYQNKPNPTRGNTRITFSIPARSKVGLNIYDVAGRRIKNLLDDAVLNSGYYGVVWDGTDLEGEKVAAGVYFYRLNVGKKSLTDKLVVVR